MSFNIVISDHIPGQTVYNVGDRITGALQFNGPIEDKNLIVTLEFFGFSSTRIELGKHTAYDNAALFSFKREFFRGPLSLEAGAQMNWTFSFVLPAQTSPHQGYHSKHPWTGELHEPPPTMSVESFLCGGTMEYGLFARAHKSTFFSFDVRKQERIELRKTQPERLSLPIIRHQLTDAVTKLPRTYLLSQPSFASWLQGCLQFGSHGVCMTIRAHIPSRVEIEKTASLQLELLPNDPFPSTDLPPVYLLSIRHTIKSRTSVRVPISRSWNLSNYKSKTALFKLKNDGRILPPGESIDVGKEFGLILPEGLQIPSFVSHNISHIYHSKTVVKVRCGETTRRLIYKVPEVEVLASGRAEKDESVEHLTVISEKN